MKRVLVGLLATLLLAGCGANTSDLQPTLAALQTQMAAPTATSEPAAVTESAPAVVDVQATNQQATIEALQLALTPTVTSTNDCVLEFWSLWGGTWYVASPQLGVFGDDPVTVNLKVLCNRNLTFSFASEGLPKVSNRFTVTMLLSEDGRETESCTLFRHFVNEDGSTFDNAWPCHFRIKNDRNTLFCGYFQKPDNTYAIYGGRNGEQETLETPCK